MSMPQKKGQPWDNYYPMKPPEGYSSIKPLLFGDAENAGDAEK
jgi:hypothetical protein